MYRTVSNQEEIIMVKTTFLTTSGLSCLFLAIASSSDAHASDHSHSLLRGEHHRDLENYGNNNHKNNNHYTIVGNDRDEHSCIGSVEYSWCASLNDCLCPFETTCPPVHDDVVPPIVYPVHDAVVHPVHHPVPPVGPGDPCSAGGETFCVYMRHCEYPGACYGGGPVLIPGDDRDQDDCRLPSSGRVLVSVLPDV